MSKKILFLLLINITLVGCSNIYNTPTSKVESFLESYQNLDSNILKELDTKLKKDKNMTSAEKKEYKTILEKQYQNLAYKINNEEVDKSIAVVDVEIEVLDYKSSLKKSKDYYLEHPELFSNSLDSEEYIDYKLKELKKVTEKVKYDLTFQLEKKEGIWQITSFTDSDRDKIHGLY